MTPAETVRAGLGTVTERPSAGIPRAHDLGGDYFTTRDRERQTRRLVNQLERLGHHVTLAEGVAAA